jgi:type VI protein secretion system component VasF
VPVAFVATLLRYALVGAAKKDQVVKRVQTAATQALETHQRTPAWARALITAAATTLLMTGFLHTPNIHDSDVSLFSSFLEAEIIFAALAAALLASIYVLPSVKRWRQWAEQADQYPAVLRLALATVASYIVCLIIVAIPGVQSSRAGEFGPEVAALLIGLALTLVLLPNGWLDLP